PAGTRPAGAPPPPPPPGARRPGPAPPRRGPRPPGGAGPRGGTPDRPPAAPRAPPRGGAGRARRPPRAPAATGAAPRAGRRAPRAWMAGAALLLAAAVGWWLWAPHASRRGRDPVLTASMMEQGFALSRAWRLEEALICFRRARDASPVDDWLTHYAIASTAAQ